jgi:outer membrane receptor protein involved in Fe transport
MKGLYFEDRLQLTSGLFYQDYDGYQLTASQILPPELILPTDSTPLRNYTANAADGTEIWGLELEAFFQLNDRWRLSGYYNYLDSKMGSHATVVRHDPEQEFTDYTYTDFVGGMPIEVTTQIPVPRDHGGDELPQMPKHKGALTLSYLVPTDNLGSFFFLTTWSYTGKRWPIGGGNIDRTRIPSYDRLDVRANWTSRNTAWTLGVFVQNVFNEIGISESIAIDGRGALTEPRHAGVQIRWRPNM